VAFAKQIPVLRRAEFPFEENTNHPRLPTAQTVLMT
jgi:hypothetical protein